MIKEQKNEMPESGNYSKAEEGKNRTSSAHLTTRLGTPHPESDRLLFTLLLVTWEPTAKKQKAALM
jgi:hypothetical protein